MQTTTYRCHNSIETAVLLHHGSPRRERCDMSLTVLVIYGDYIVQKTQILIVEDDTNIFEAFQDILLLAFGDNVEITWVQRAEAALALDLSGHRIIITDFNLGSGMKGNELVSALRAKYADSIYIVGASNDDTAPKLFAEAGVNAYHDKLSSVLISERIAHLF